MGDQSQVTVGQARQWLTEHPNNMTQALQARAAAATFDNTDGLTWLPAWRLRDMIVKREVSSVEVVKHFLDRIEQFDSALHAFRNVDARGALQQAARADTATKGLEGLGPLHGVPIALKELFFVRGFPVPGSYFSYIDSPARKNPALAQRDDIEVERLRAAGAVVVGTTVASIGPTPVLDAANLPRNPWDIACTAGGSSAGNGAAIAGGLLPMAIGDDGAGSTRVPSAFCGLVGLHPTRGRIPHIDYKSVAPRATVTVGPMVRDVRDAAIAMQVLAGPDGRDFVCMQEDPPDYVDALHDQLKDARFAWTPDFGFTSMPDEFSSAQVVSTIYKATNALRRSGCTVTDCATTWEDPWPAWSVSQHLSGAAMSMPDSTEVALPMDEAIAALSSRQRNWQRFREVFRSNDFVISPTVKFAAPKVERLAEAWLRGDPGQKLHQLGICAHTMMCNLLGLPAISVPSGFVGGLPIALQIIGKPNSDAQLLQVANTFLSAVSAE